MAKANAFSAIMTLSRACLELKGLSLSPALGFFFPFASVELRFADVSFDAGKES